MEVMVFITLEWLGMALGLGGAVLVSGRAVHRRRIGFAAWVLSNLCWITWGLHQGVWGLVAMQVCFLGTSIAGWWNHREAAQERTQEPDAASAPAVGAEVRP